MAFADFPEFIRNLPQADVPLAGLTAYLLEGKNGQITFLDTREQEFLPEHTHGGQWGIVTAGKVELTIGDETNTYGPGDSYYIPAGTPHKAILHKGFKALDVFEDSDRYKPRS